MSTENQLATINQSTGSLIEAVIKIGLTEQSVSVIERLVALREREDIRNAELSFNRAFVAMQSEIPVIVASSVIPNRGKYEKFEDVMRVVHPILNRHGFSVSFSQAADEKRITVTCFLRHEDGHAITTAFSVRVGGKADSETQADCKASTTAKRNALLQALNIVIRQDIFQSDEADAMIEGGKITDYEAAELRLLCEESGSDVTRFLAFAGAKSFEEITTSRHADLLQKLKAKLSK